MQAIERKRKKSRPLLRWIALGVILVILAGSTAAWHLTRKPPAEPPEREITTGLLANYGEDQVRRVEVIPRQEAPWVLTVAEDGKMSLSTDGKTFTPDEALAQYVLQTVSVLEYQERLADSLTEIAPTPEEMEAFGFQQPRMIVRVSYSDGAELVMTVGGKSADADEPCYYMTVEGDPALYALDVGTVQELSLSASVFHPLIQPEIQAARIDSISIQNGGETRRWQLEGSVTDGDAQDRWIVSQPFVYSAEGESVAALRKNAANLRMGGFEAEATEENLILYGMNEPRAIITVHMAAGTTLSANDDGTMGERDWPEETLVFTVGKAKSDLVDYVLWQDSICSVSRFLIDAVTGTKPRDTLTRYPVRTSLSNLRRLTVQTTEQYSVYEVTRTEQVAQNNELVLDADGNPVVDESVVWNGFPLPWEAFEVLYGQMLLVTVSGALPEGWQGNEAEAHTRMTFETVTGTTHVISLTDFDSFHDAVWVDGYALFYLVKGGFPMTAPITLDDPEGL